jgi:hypothetical protein
VVTRQRILHFIALVDLPVSHFLLIRQGEGGIELDEFSHCRDGLREPVIVAPLSSESPAIVRKGGCFIVGQHELPRLATLEELERQLRVFRAVVNTRTTEGLEQSQKILFFEAVKPVEVEDCLIALDEGIDEVVVELSVFPLHRRIPPNEWSCRSSHPHCQVLFDCELSEWHEWRL